MFNDVGRNQFIRNTHNTHNYGMSRELEEIAYVDKLPRALGAGCSSGNHKPCLSRTRTTVLGEIETWEVDDASPPVFGLKGVSGSGKSAIAQTFAERSAAREQLGASFFCSRDFPTRRNLRLIFPTLAHQLAYRYPDFRTALVRIIRHVPDVDHDSLAVQFEKLIVRPLRSTRISTTIFVDALDECEDKESVSAFLSALATYIDEIPNVKFFITGRPEEHIRLGFAIPSLRTKELALHDVEPSAVNSDIRLFVESQLREIATQNDRCIVGSWPSEKDIANVTEKSAGLFIIARLILDFINYPRTMPQDRLKLIIGVMNSTIYEGQSGIDVIYSQILWANFLTDTKKDDPWFFDRLRLVLGSIVLSFHPLSCDGLGRLLGMPLEEIWTVLRSLHSVLIVPMSNSEPVRVCHKSFADFLTDPQRCINERFYINAPAFHAQLCDCCLTLMNGSLVENICHLPRYALNKDIEDLDARRGEYIGPLLAYACKYWAKHLQRSSGASDASRIAVELVDQFFKTHFLSWLEVLSIDANLCTAILSVHDVKSWLKDTERIRDNGTTMFWLGRMSTTWNSISPVSRLSDLIDDCERFVLRFFEPVEASAMHIYHSALPWSPVSSRTREVYCSQLKAEAKPVNAVDTTWGACIRTISVRESVLCIELSPKGTTISVLVERRMKVFDTVTGMCLAIFEGQHSVETIAFSLDDNFIASGLSDGTVSVFEVQTGDLIHTFQGHTGKIWSIAFSPCGAMIASGSDDKTIRIWNMSPPDCKHCLEGHSGEVRAVCWSATGNRVISGSSDMTVRTWTLDNTSKPIPSELIHTHADTVTSIASFQDLIAWGTGDGVVQIYSNSGFHRVISTNEHIHSVRFSVCGDKIMFTYGDSASICDSGGNRHLSTIKHDGYFAKISPDGNWVASDSGNFVNIWKIESGYTNSKAADHDSDPVMDVSFAPDGRLVASRTYGDVLKIWHTTSGECLSTRVSHGIDPIVFSPNSESFSACSSTSRESSHGFSFDVDGSTILVTSNESHTDRGRISPVPLLHQCSSNDELASQPMEFVPTEEQQSHEEPSVHEQYFRYKEHDEWIFDQDDKRVLWVPPNRRDVFSVATHRKKIALGTWSGRVYMINFSGTLSS